MAMYNWQQKTDTLEYEMQDGSQVRFTFGVCTGRHQARHAANTNRILTYFRETYGVDRFGEALSAVFGGTPTPEQQEAVDLYYPEYLRLSDWSALAVALRKIETRPGAGSEWTETEIPDELMHPATALDSLWLPPGVLEAADEVVNALNPGVFSTFQKKAVRILGKDEPAETPSETPNEAPLTTGAKLSSKRKSDSSEPTTTND